MLAYRNIKANTGSYTEEQISRISVTSDGFHRLRSSVRSEKSSQAASTAIGPNLCAGKTFRSPTAKQGRWDSLCIWDRLVQQCIKQILEPICEAKFSSNSYGFRPNRSVENAIAAIIYTALCRGQDFTM